MPGEQSPVILGINTWFKGGTTRYTRQYAVARQRILGGPKAPGLPGRPWSRRSAVVGAGGVQDAGVGSGGTAFSRVIRWSDKGWGARPLGARPHDVCSSPWASRLRQHRGVGGREGPGRGACSPCGAVGVRGGGLAEWFGFSWMLLLIVFAID